MRFEGSPNPCYTHGIRQHPQDLVWGDAAEQVYNTGKFGDFQTARSFNDAFDF